MSFDWFFVRLIAWLIGGLFHGPVFLLIHRLSECSIDWLINDLVLTISHLLQQTFVFIRIPNSDIAFLRTWFTVTRIGSWTVHAFYAREAAIFSGRITAVSVACSVSRTSNLRVRPTFFESDFAQFLSPSYVSSLQCSLFRFALFLASIAAVCEWPLSKPTTPLCVLSRNVPLVIVIYLIWVFVPPEYLEQFGIDFLPSQ